MSEPRGQSRTVVPREGGSPLTVISSAREVEQGARSVLLLAKGLFRLDVVPYDDMIHTVLRNLSTEPRAELRIEDVGGGAIRVGEGAGAIAPPTGRFGGKVALISARGDERVVARILVGSIHHPARGVTGFTAQATLS
jgi:hypothetical protein